ncbi:hypothetical protein D3C71_1652550 [compost metagenome]
MLMTTSPACAVWMTPSGPAITSSACAVVSTMEMTMPASRAASAGPVAARAPSSTKRRTLALSMSHTTSGWPFFSRFSAMGPPIMPRPIKATVCSLACLLICIS